MTSSIGKRLKRFGWEALTIYTFVLVLSGSEVQAQTSYDYSARFSGVVVDNSNGSTRVPGVSITVAASSTQLLIATNGQTATNINGAYDITVYGRVTDSTMSTSPFIPISFNICYSKTDYLPQCVTYSNNIPYTAYSMSQVYNISLQPKNFQVGGQRWNAESGGFRVQGSALLPNFGVGTAFLEGVIAQDVSASVDINAPNSSSQYCPGISARHNANGDVNMYLGTICKTGNKATAQIWKNLLGTWTLLSQASVSASINGTLKFDAIGSSLKLYLNNNIIASATDASIVAGGRIGIRTIPNNSGSVSNFRYSSNPMTSAVNNTSFTGNFSLIGNQWEIYTQTLRHLYVAPKGTGSQVATWTIPNLQPGYYKVSTSWLPSSTNRASNVPYSIYDGSQLLASVSVNQKTTPSDFTDANGNAWRVISQQVRSNTGSISVRINNAADNFVVADAIRVDKVQVQLPPSPINLNVTVNSATQLTASWMSAGGSTQGFYVSFAQGTTAGDCMAGVDVGAQTSQVRSNLVTGQPYTFTVCSYDAFGNVSPVVSSTKTPAVAAPVPLIVTATSPNFKRVGAWTYYPSGWTRPIYFAAAGNGSTTGTWTYSGLAAGKYRVSTNWMPASTNRSSNVPYSVTGSGSVLATAVVDQRTNPNDFTDAGVAWKILAPSVTITNGALSVTITNKANNFVVADSVRLDYIGP